MNYTTEKTHISLLQKGDTIMRDGVMHTLSSANLKRNPFMGPTIYGDSYKLGREPVIKVIFPRFYCGKQIK